MLLHCSRYQAHGESCAAVHTVPPHLPSPPLPLHPFPLPPLPLSPVGALRAPVATGHPTRPGQLHQCEGVSPLTASGQLRAGWTGVASGGWGRGGTWIGGGTRGSSRAKGQALRLPQGCGHNSFVLHSDQVCGLLYVRPVVAVCYCGLVGVPCLRVLVHRASLQHNAGLFRSCPFSTSPTTS